MIIGCPIKSAVGLNPLQARHPPPFWGIRARKKDSSTMLPSGIGCPDRVLDVRLPRPQTVGVHAGLRLGLPHREENASVLRCLWSLGDGGWDHHADLAHHLAVRVDFDGRASRPRYTTHGRSGARAVHEYESSLRP